MDEFLVELFKPIPVNVDQSNFGPSLCQASAQGPTYGPGTSCYEGNLPHK